MSNFDRAVKALNDVGEYIDYLEGNIAYVTALEAAGLLAPDLPEPDVIRPGNRTKSWFDENIYAYEGSGKVRVIADDVFFPVDDAREHALSVLVACEYAEKEQGNEQF